MKDNKQYGLPKLKKYPMPDKRHVKSAIRFFNYVSPAQEKELARAIMKKMKKYGLRFTDFTVGDENRFRKYVPEKYLTHSEVKPMYSNNDFRYYKGGDYLAHYGVKGMKWKKHRNAHQQQMSDQYLSGAKEMATDNYRYHKDFKDIQTKKVYAPLKKKLATSDRTKHVVDTKYALRSKKEDANWARKLRRIGNKNKKKSVLSGLIRIK